MNDLMVQLQPYIISICVTILTSIASYIGLKIKTIYEEKVNTETKRKIVSDTCKYIEQIYNDLSGQEKLEKAVIAIEEQLREKGIAITELELRVILESTVHSFKETL